MLIIVRFTITDIIMIIFTITDIMNNMITCPNFLLSFSARECLFTTEKQSRFLNTSSMLAGWLNRTTTYNVGVVWS